MSKVTNLSTYTLPVRAQTVPSLLFTLYIKTSIKMWHADKKFMQIILTVVQRCQLLEVINFDSTKSRIVSLENLNLAAVLSKKRYSCGPNFKHFCQMLAKIGNCRFLVPDIYITTLSYLSSYICLLGAKR